MTYIRMIFVIIVAFSVADCDGAYFERHHKCIIMSRPTTQSAATQGRLNTQPLSVETRVTSADSTVPASVGEKP